MCERCNQSVSLIDFGRCSIRNMTSDVYTLQYKLSEHVANNHYVTQYLLASFIDIALISF